jgi:hypothetical protein
MKIDGVGPSLHINSIKRTLYARQLDRALQSVLMEMVPMGLVIVRIEPRSSRRHRLPNFR